MFSFMNDLPKGNCNITVSKELNEDVECDLCRVNSNKSYRVTTEMYIEKTDTKPDNTYKVKLCSEGCISLYIQNSKNFATLYNHNIIRM